MDLAGLLGIELPNSGDGLSLRELAKAKGLPEEFLRAWGVTDGFAGSGKNRLPNDRENARPLDRRP